MSWNPFESDLRRYSLAEVCSLVQPFFRNPSLDLPEEMCCNFYDKKDFMIQCLSEMLFFAAIAEKKNRSGYSVVPADYPVFGKECPPLAGLLKKADHAAAVHFPTDHEECICMYVFPCVFPDYRDHKKMLAHSEEIPPDYSVFLVNETTMQPVSRKIDGDSWTLAFQTAVKVIRTGYDRSEIAHKWLFTGKCGKDQNAVEAVKIEGKEKLFGKNGRKVILPFACINECPPGEKLFHVHDLNSCWRIITGQGFAEKNGFTLEKEIDSLHILVGGTIQPVISVILLLNPKKIHLWFSEVTRAKGELIAGALQMEHFNIELHEMDSHNLSHAYSEIQQVLIQEKDMPAVYVCNTGGNRLMGTAALVAAADIHRKVIYRDYDSEYNSLTVISKQQEWESGDIYVSPGYKPAPGKSIDWQWLYSKPDRDVIHTPDELHRLFIR